MSDTLRWLGRTIRLTSGDITRMHVDMIVNAANSQLRGGGGVDGAIHAAAGPAVMDELIQGHPDGTPTGTAALTTGGRLRARWIAHAVGPVWRGGLAREPEQLAGAHTSAMDLADQVGATTIAFPAISCGIYGYPPERAAPVALGAVHDWLEARPDSPVKDIVFVLRGDEITHAFRTALSTLTEDVLP